MMQITTLSNDAHTLLINQNKTLEDWTGISIINPKYTLGYSNIDG